MFQTPVPATLSNNKTEGNACGECATKKKCQTQGEKKEVKQFSYLDRLERQDYKTENQREFDKVSDREKENVSFRWPRLLTPGGEAGPAEKAIYPYCSIGKKPAKREELGVYIAR